MSLGVNPRVVKWLWTPWARWIWCLDDLKWEIPGNSWKKWGFSMKVYKVWFVKVVFSTVQILVEKRFWFASWNLTEYSQFEDSKSSDIILYDDSLREIAEVDDVRIVRSRFEIKEALGPYLMKVAWQTQKGGPAKVRKSWLLSLPHFQMQNTNDVKVSLDTILAFCIYHYNSHVSFELLVPQKKWSLNFAFQ